MEGLLGCAANLDIECGASVVAFEERKEDLFGVLAETAIADIADDADDDDTGLDARGASAPADADPEGIAAGQIALDEGLVNDGGGAAGFADGTEVARVEIAAGEERTPRVAKKPGLTALKSQQPPRSRSGDRSGRSLVVPAVRR